MSTAILYSSSNKSIKNGTSTRIQWTHTLQKSESSKISSQDWKSTTSIAITTADVLSKLGSTRAPVPPGIFVHELHHPSVKEQSQQATDTEAPATVREVLMIDEDWQTQFIDFIKEFKFPPHIDPKSAEAAHITSRSKGFVLVGDNLYKRINGLVLDGLKKRLYDANTK